MTSKRALRQPLRNTGTVLGAGQGWHRETVSIQVSVSAGLPAASLSITGYHLFIHRFLFIPYPSVICLSTCRLFIYHLLPVIYLSIICFSIFRLLSTYLLLIVYLFTYHLASCLSSVIYLPLIYCLFICHLFISLPTHHLFIYLSSVCHLSF